MTHTETTAPCFAIETPESGKETIMLMDAKALARHIMRMDFGTETELYLYADADGKRVECAAALRKERWKDTEFCLLGGYGLPVKDINIERGCSLADWHRPSATRWTSSVTAQTSASSSATGKWFSMLFSQPKPQYYG